MSIYLRKPSSTVSENSSFGELPEAPSRTVKNWITNWMDKADITKSIIFHCFRHTYATIQLTLGTDIYLLSKELGHKSLKNTEIYAKIVDKRKKEAAEQIPELEIII